MSDFGDQVEQAAAVHNVVPLPLPDRMIAKNFRRVDKGALIGFFDLQIVAWHMLLYDCKWFAKGGSEWIGLPSSRYQDRNDKTHYKNLVEFADKETHERFQKAAIAAVRKLA